jgi:hypothetical protein
LLLFFKKAGLAFAPIALRAGRAFSRLATGIAYAMNQMQGGAAPAKLKPKLQRFEYTDKVT